ncbi:protein of unknown function [Magnetospirillum sp. XM-1]|nr:protein of unknown function [Magnetospirillum sp. XM-1]
MGGSLRQSCCRRTAFHGLDGGWGLAQYGAMIPVTHRISIDESEIEESFVRAAGPGGQNVNAFRTS